MNESRSGKTSGRRIAAALKYRQGEDIAPRLVAKGMGKIAERIIEAAREAGVSLYEDPDLCALLTTLNLDEQIPANMYAAVAEVLAFVYRLNRSRSAGQ